MEIVGRIEFMLIFQTTRKPSGTANRRDSIFGVEYLCLPMIPFLAALTWEEAAAASNNPGLASGTEQHSQGRRQKTAQQELTCAVARRFHARTRKVFPRLLLAETWEILKSRATNYPGEDPAVQSHVILLLKNLTSRIEIVKRFLRR